MARQNASWFLSPRAPNFDISPNGYLKLGSIISDPGSPDRPISSGVPPDLPDDVHVVKAWKTSWRDVSAHRSKGKVGLWFRFLQMIGVIDAGVDWSAAQMNAYNFTKLEIDWFTPSKSLVKERMDNAEVKEYCGIDTTHPNVYMITAVMIARHPIVKWTDDHHWAWHTEAGANLTAAGAPDTSVGANASHESSDRHQVSAESSSDFVFAYRLSKITYARKSFFKRAGVLKETPHQKGAAFGEGGSVKDEMSYTLDLDDLDSLGIQNLTARALGVNVEDVDNDFDDEATECILPG
jgi:hypothetical protein